MKSDDVKLMLRCNNLEDKLVEAIDYFNASKGNKESIIRHPARYM